MIRLATPADWPTIAAWRTEHHERMRARNGKPIVAGVGLADAVWLVSAELVPLAAISFRDVGRTRILHDFYWRRGFAGKRAAYVLAATVIGFARDLRLDSVAGDTNIVNVEYRVLLRRLGFRPESFDYPNDVCYFRRNTEGFTNGRKLESHRSNQPESSRLSAAAGHDSAPAHYRATGQ